MRKRALIPIAIAIAVVAATAAACGGGGESAAAPQTPAAPSAPSSASLTIQHVEPGCHLWSNGQTQAETMQLSLAKGGTLTLVNHDIDTHQLVQEGGPTLQIGGPMMAVSGQESLSFAVPGVYTFGTKVVEDESAATMDEDQGAMGETGEETPDHVLKLVVRVA